MRLRRITKQFKVQNWFAVALDFFIVVAYKTLNRDATNVAPIS